jgi:hypothetical protein
MSRKVVQKCDSYSYIAPVGAVGEVAETLETRLLVRWPDCQGNLYGIHPSKVIYLDKENTNV